MMRYLGIYVVSQYRGHFSPIPPAENKDSAVRDDGGMKIARKKLLQGRPAPSNPTVVIRSSKVSGGKWVLIVTAGNIDTALVVAYCCLISN
jgi:hypothetical protein